MKRRSKRYLPLARRQRDFVFREKSSFKPVSKEDFCPVGNILETLEPLIHHLKNFSAYQNLGAELPAGAIFYGPTGTGKTYAARFLATEANATFVDVQEFPHAEDESTFLPADIHMLFSLGRQMVQKTKKPCVLFWEHFDMFLKDASEETVGRLYAELDGITGGSNGIFLVAATAKDIHDSDQEIFDEQLLRSGRLNIQIEFTYPIRTQQQALLRHYLEKRPHGPINCEALIHLLDNPTPATIKDLTNEAYRRACRREFSQRHKPLHKPCVTKEDLMRALIQILQGHSLKIDLSPDEKETLSLHETGHALVARALGRPVQLISLVPAAGNDLGGTISILPKNIFSEEDIRDKLTFLAGGLAVEKLIGISTVHSRHEDLEIVTGIAKDLITRTAHGPLLFRSFGPMAIKSEAALPLSQTLLETVEKDIGAILKKQYRRAYAILARIGKKRIRYIAQELLKKDPPIILQEEFDTIQEAAFRKFPRGG